MLYSESSHSNWYNLGKATKLPTKKALTFSCECFRYTWRPQGDM